LTKKRAAEQTPVVPDVTRRSRAAKTGIIRDRVSPELKAEAEGIGGVQE
jgi:hypothetical protein